MTTFILFLRRLSLFCMTVFVSAAYGQKAVLTLNEQEYFEMPGLNVMVFHDFYPEGHQSGISIIQNGVRVATNGDLRLEPTPGQWQPVPKVGERKIDINNQSLSVQCTYPNPDKNRKGFNPIKYPDFTMNYQVRVRAEGTSFRIIVDLEQPLRTEWIGKVGFNLELFPGELFGKAYFMDEKTGYFPRQFNGPMIGDTENNFQTDPLAEGKILVVAPEDEAKRITISSNKGSLVLLDGRAHHNNGWFIVRSEVAAGATKSAIEWLVTPNVLMDWQEKTVIQVSQVGYHPYQKKKAFIACDLRDERRQKVELKRLLSSGELETVISDFPEYWGKFLRYQYLLFDFTTVTENGLYRLSYGDSKSHFFRISSEVYDRHVWQPTLLYFLPVQMCHMRVNDRYRVWHGLCHMDDALMAPVDTLHFDGYEQGSSTLTKYKPYQHVPGLNVGGWHDAGDYDLRIESQAATVYILSLTYEEFNLQYDQTTIDQDKHLVEIHRPDGIPDVLQQIEHGVHTILAGYENLGRLYRGIICSDLRQYVLLGDGSTMTDNRFYNPNLGVEEIRDNESGVFDDRWVFTEDNPRRELFVAACLAAASRVMKGYKNELALACQRTAESLWLNSKNKNEFPAEKIQILVELALTTNHKVYKDSLIQMLPDIQKNIRRVGWILGRILSEINNEPFKNAVTEAVRSHYDEMKKNLEENPFGVPYRPRVWGAGWNIQRFGVQNYFLHTAWPDIISKEHMFNALNFILGCHPGVNTASYASGVGVKSVTTAYGTNRADWSYIPGGVVSGTGLIRPDLAELKEWPFLWQQTEYVIGGGASNFMFLVLAANHLLNEK